MDIVKDEDGGTGGMPGQEIEIPECGFEAVVAIDKSQVDGWDGGKKGWQDRVEIAGDEVSADIKGTKVGLSFCGYGRGAFDGI